MSGWLKIHRKLTDWEWYKDANTLRVWLHILLNCTSKPMKSGPVKLEPGEWISGRRQIAKDLNMSEQQVKTALNHLLSTQEITQKTSRRFTIYKVVNWELYQGTNPVTNPQPTHSGLVTHNQPKGNPQVTQLESKNPTQTPTHTDGAQTAVPTAETNIHTTHTNPTGNQQVTQWDQNGRANSVGLPTRKQEYKNTRIQECTYNIYCNTGVRTPTEDEFVSYCESRGCVCGKTWYDTAQGCGWKDFSGNAITSWKAFFGALISKGTDYVPPKPHQQTVPQLPDWYSATVAVPADPEALADAEAVQRSLYERRTRKGNGEN